MVTPCSSHSYRGRGLDWGSPSVSPPVCQLNLGRAQAGARTRYQELPQPGKSHDHREERRQIRPDELPEIPGVRAAGGGGGREGERAAFRAGGSGARGFPLQPGHAGGRRRHRAPEGRAGAPEQPVAPGVQEESRAGPRRTRSRRERHWGAGGRGHGLAGRRRSDRPPPASARPLRGARGGRRQESDRGEEEERESRAGGGGRDEAAGQAKRPEEIQKGHRQCPPPRLGDLHRQPVQRHPDAHLVSVSVALLVPAPAPRAAVPDRLCAGGVPLSLPPPPAPPPAPAKPPFETGTCQHALNPFKKPVTPYHVSP